MERKGTFESSSSQRIVNDVLLHVMQWTGLLLTIILHYGFVIQLKKPRYSRSIFIQPVALFITPGPKPGDERRLSSCSLFGSNNGLPSSLCSILFLLCAKNLHAGKTVDVSAQQCSLA